MTRQTTIFALLALLAAQAVAAEDVSPEQAGVADMEQSTPADTPAQATKGMSAAIRVFAAEGEEASAPASTAPATSLQSKEEAEKTSGSAHASDAGNATSAETPAANTTDTDQPEQEASQAESDATEAEPASLPAGPPLGSFGSLPPGGSTARARSMAEGQAQLTRAAAAQVATQVGFVSVGNALRVEMVYGQSWPTLVCKYNLTCLLELEPGEEIADTQILADSVRWEAALRYREQPVHQAYIAFKPRPDAEETNFILVTDRRVYSLLLVPDHVVHTPILSFRYPKTEAAKMARRIEDQKSEKRASASAATAARQKRVNQSGVSTVRGAVPADELDFNYRITGRAPFKPVRIYTDGRRTYIDLPEKYRGELPVLLASSAKANSAVNIKVGKNGKQLIADKMLTGFALAVGRQRIQVRKGN